MQNDHFIDFDNILFYDFQSIASKSKKGQILSNRFSTQGIKSDIKRPIDNIKITI